MTKRIEFICREIEKCKVFLDIGCDHGFISEYVLKNNLCDLNIISDISKKSLNKAENLLKDYIAKKKCKSYCTSGFNGIEEKADTAVIAGMGGMEIIDIFNNSKYLPEKIIIQPMKNTEQLRKYLVNNYKFIKDFTFFDQDKFYDLIVCKKGKDILTEREILFGRDNLKDMTSDFILKIKQELEIKKDVLKSNINEKNRQKILTRIEILEEILNEYPRCI